jgi:hypothetical protein
MLPVDIHREAASQAILLKHMPEEGSEAFAVTLFEPAHAAMIDRYEQIHGLRIPTPVREMLKHFNGAFLHELSLFGLPVSMSRDPPLLSRGGRNPFDLATGARAWSGGYQAEDRSEFLFGSRNAGYELQYGYFLRENGSVARYPRLKDDAAAKVWPSFDEFFRSEVEETIRHQPAYLRDCEEGSRKAGYSGGWQGVVRALGLRRFLPK